jgi:hypothetical protein
MKNFYVTFAIDARYTVCVQADNLKQAKREATLDFEAEDFGEMEFVDSKLTIVEDENGNYIYEA